MSNTSTEYLTTIAEAAERLALSRHTVIKLIERGELTTVKIGRSVRIHGSTIDRLMVEGGSTGKAKHERLARIQEAAAT